MSSMKHTLPGFWDTGGTEGRDFGIRPAYVRAADAQLNRAKREALRVAVRIVSDSLPLNDKASPEYKLKRFVFLRSVAPACRGAEDFFRPKQIARVLELDETQVRELVGQLAKQILHAEQLALKSLTDADLTRAYKRFAVQWQTQAMQYNVEKPVPPIDVVFPLVPTLAEERMGPLLPNPPQPEPGGLSLT